MSPIDQRKLKILLTAYGTMSAEDALDCAAQAERTYTGLSQTDTHARAHFWQQRQDFLTLAALLDVAARESSRAPAVPVREA